VGPGVKARFGETMATSIVDNPHHKGSGKNSFCLPKKRKKKTGKWRTGGPPRLKIRGVGCCAHGFDVFLNRQKEKRDPLFRIRIKERNAPSGGGMGSANFPSPHHLLK